MTAGASTLVVTNTNDSGPGSFRQALVYANADAGPRDTITFNIPGAGPHTIRPTKLPDLPTITQPVIIDGTTQPGYAGTPLIEISGENADVVNGLVIAGGNSIVRGLAINRFPLSGILVPSPGNVFEGNFLGTNTAGTAALPNGDDGIKVRGSGNTIGGTTPGAGNLISGNLNDGVDLGAGATNTLVQGNRIGTNAAGTAAIPNGFQGVFIGGGASNNTIGGVTAAARNILSGNTSSGLVISGTGTTANTVIGNFIGTNAAGTAAVANLINGLAFVAGAAGNTVGGFQPTERNLISGNQGVGVGFFGTPGAGGNSLISNLVGTDVTGTAALGNSGSGVYIQTSGNNIGSLTTGVGNTIAFNGSVGVRVDSGTGNAIVYNQIFSNGRPRHRPRAARRHAERRRGRGRRRQ